MPVVTSYYAIYTLAQVGQAVSKFGMNWDLHATATDRDRAIAHAKMLALQPGVAEVHVKEVIENSGTGHVSVRNIKTCKAGGLSPQLFWGATATAILCIVSAVAFIY